MSQPSILGNQIPASDDYIMRKLRDLEREIQQMRAERALAASSIDDGELHSGNFRSGREGWALNGDGNLEINDITLHGGIIGNDALSTPISVATASGATTNFGVLTTDQALATVAIAVPEGFTRALVYMTTSVGCWNDATVVDYLYVAASIQGVKSREMTDGAEPSSFATLMTAKASRLTGLSGGEISLTSLVHAGSSVWGTNTSNRAYLEAFAVFLR